jgi:pimeloyl-ACP methyl ester carboxylesterase
MTTSSAWASGWRQTTRDDRDDPRRRRRTIHQLARARRRATTEGDDVRKQSNDSGYFGNGVPFNRIGHGRRSLAVFQGLLFENAPLTGAFARAMLGAYRFLGDDYTVFVMTRRPGLPPGYSMGDMANDYAVAIRDELGGPVDVVGLSTGGSIALYFAADHPELLRRLVIHSGAYTLSEPAKALQLRVGELALQRRWQAAYATIFGTMLPRHGVMKYASLPLAGWGSALAAWRTAPASPSDLLVTIQAEDKHDFRERLGEIAAPTLVAAGVRDFFFTPELFRDTAAGIPEGGVIVYPGKGHPASGEQFREDVTAFLREGRD